MNWVIQARTNGRPPIYWTGSGFTLEPKEAYRFEREANAEVKLSSAKMYLPRPWRETEVAIKAVELK